MFFNTTKFYTMSFFCKHNFFIDEKHTQWMLDTKVKVFHESISRFMKWPWNCISWNPLKEKFHSVSFPLDILKIHWKTPVLDPLFDKVAGKYSVASVFLWTIKIFKNICFAEHLLATFLFAEYLRIRSFLYYSLNNCLKVSSKKTAQEDFAKFTGK